MFSVKIFMLTISTSFAVLTLLYIGLKIHERNDPHSPDPVSQAIKKLVLTVFILWWIITWMVCKYS